MGNYYERFAAFWIDYRVRDSRDFHCLHDSILHHTAKKAFFMSALQNEVQGIRFA